MYKCKKGYIQSIDLHWFSTAMLWMVSPGLSLRNKKSICGCQFLFLTLHDLIAGGPIARILPEKMCNTEFCENLRKKMRELY